MLYNSGARRLVPKRARDVVEGAARTALDGVLREYLFVDWTIEDLPKVVEVGVTEWTYMAEYVSELIKLNTALKLGRECELELALGWDPQQGQITFYKLDEEAEYEDQPN